MGAPLPEWHTPPAVARELARARPPRRQRGLVVFLTGLPGSGKSTIARGVADALLETGERTVTLLDGDVVRRELSPGLGFSKSDRDLNSRRIGWVAAEAARHGGLALCCPIAPDAQARAGVRELSRLAGAGFELIYLSTPGEVCAQRASKRLPVGRGDAQSMTAMDDTYEPPTDAGLVLDTTRLSVEDSVARVLEYLGAEGWIDPRHLG